MNVSFPRFAEKLSSDVGGCCIWLGAGASIALTRGATPSWPALVTTVAAEHGKPEPDNADLPEGLEQLSQAIGHTTFRAELRKHLVDPILSAPIDLNVAANQAVIGARAGSLVSFNVEAISATPFALLTHGQTIWRTFRERTDFAANIFPKPKSGAISKPIYFPHGLLPFSNVVMTKSEYARHLGSLAVTTAVHLAIGADLVILGMSLADRYLREAILQNRRWLRDVYWLGASFAFQEWARVAHVTCVRVDHADLWPGLAKAILAADHDGGIAQLLDHRRPQLGQIFTDLISWHSRIPTALDALATQLLGSAHPLEHIIMFEQACVDAGYPVPPALAAHLALAMG